MTDFTKAYCNLHPHELITNFCAKDQCLVGLCANCICTHTQSHVEKGTSPHYENIRNTCKRMQECLRAQMKVFDDDRDRIMNISQKVREKRDKVDELIDKAKTAALEAIDQYFEEKRSRMLREIEVHEKQAGLHCQNRLEFLLNSISRQNSSLITAAQDLNSSTFLESLPRVRMQTLVNAENLHNDLNEQLTQNEGFQTVINFHQNCIPTLAEFVDKAVTIGFTQNGNRLDIKAQPHDRRPSSVSRVSETQSRHIIKSNEFKNNPSINFKLESGGQRNSQSQITLSHPNFHNPQPNLQQSVSHVRKQWNDGISGSAQNFYQPPAFHSNQSFRPSNFAPESPIPNQGYIVPLGANNQNPNLSMPRSQSQQKVSMSRVSRLEGPNFMRPTVLQSSFNSNNPAVKTSGIGRKSKKSGLRVLQTHEGDRENISSGINYI